jgi:hypothetical protein
MNFVLLCIDKPNHIETRLANREAHLAYVAENSSAIKIAGPILGDDNETMAGSMLIFEADDRSNVEEWSKNDPYAKAGLFESVQIRPFRWAVGNPEAK